MGLIGHVLLAVAHALGAAGWLGAMSYSLVVAQPRLLRFFDSPEAAEEPATVLAAGARWRVVGLIAWLAATGAGLALVAGSDRSGWWWAVVAVKAALTAVAAVVFWYVSWRMWPRRLFALPAEVAGHQARFRRVGALLLTLVGAAFVLGVAAHVIV